MDGTDHFNFIQKKQIDIYSCLQREQKNNRENKKTIKNLSEEIREKIFSYLSIQDLANTEQVCREWKTNQEFCRKFFYETFEKKLGKIEKKLPVDQLLLIVKKINSDSDKGQEALFQLAKLCTEKNEKIASSFIKIFHLFDIKDQKTLIKIAKLCAQNTGYKTAKHIEVFGIKDQQDLVEIAQICAQSSNRYEILKYIKNFGITDQQAIVEIAKICARKSSEIVQHIKNFDIKDQQALIEIAKICARYDAWRICRRIDNFDIKDQQGLIEIAKICAKKDGATARYIKKFGIRDQQALIEIARICAQKHKKGKKGIEEIPLCIKNFGIKDQQTIIEIAMLCAKNSPCSTAEHIKQFEIEDPQILIKIAKICAKKDGRSAWFIKNFGIIDQKALIEIARICARKDSEKYPATPQSIKHFGIKDPQILIEIAKICVQKNSSGVAAYIQNFHIEDQRTLSEIALICAKNAPEITAKNIKNFDIKDKQTLMEIAKICAQNDSWTAFYINSFNIQDKEALIEIAKICLQQSPVRTAQYIDNFSTDLGTLIEIVNICIQEFAYKQQWKPYLKEFLEYLGTKRDLYAQKQVHIWALKTLVALRGESEEKIAYLNPILTNLANYRSPIMRKLLSKLMINFYRTDYRTDLIKKVQKQEIKSTNKSYNHQKALIAFLLSSLIISQKERLVENQRICKEFIKFFYLYPESHHGNNQRIVVELLYHLHQTSVLTLEEKMQILSSLVESLKLPDSNIKQKQANQQEEFQFYNGMKSAQIAQDLIQLGRAERLKEITNYQEINLQMEKLYEVELGVQTENFTEQYFKTIEKWRNKQAIWTYYAVQKNNKRNVQFFKMFVQSVLDESFKIMRYQNDPHLLKIFQIHPELEELWKKGEKVHEQEFSIKSSGDQPTLSVKKIYEQLKGSIREKHLGEPELEVKTNYPYLFEYLFSEKGNNCNYYLSKIKKDLTQAQKNKDFKKSKDLTFQMQFLQLEQIQDKDAVTKLKALLKNYCDEKNTQFKQDIQDCLNRLTNQEKGSSSNRRGWIVEDTDDPCDLLLLGTEVRQSCQRLNGDSYLNQGLLGYLLNGKNRAIVVKDHEGKILGRRLLRLLWDQKEKKAVLFQEPYYSAVEDREVKILVDEMCKRRACALDLPLLIKEGHESYPSAVLYPSPVSSLGGQCPIEYVDALRGVQNSVFEIDNCKRIA